MDINKTPSQKDIDEYFMEMALREAHHALAAEEVPIGAVVIHQGKIIGRGDNSNRRLKDPTAHAEMIAITSACNHLQSRYLEDTTLYVTIEPCSMCAGAIVLARLPRLVFGAYDTKAGACGSVFNLVQDPRLNHTVEVISGVKEFDCAGVISQFFEKYQNKNGQA